MEAAPERPAGSEAKQQQYTQRGHNIHKNRLDRNHIELSSIASLFSSSVSYERLNNLIFCFPLLDLDLT